MPDVDQAPPYSAALESALLDAKHALARAANVAICTGRSADAMRLRVAHEATERMLVTEQQARIAQVRP